MIFDGDSLPLANPRALAALAASLLCSCATAIIVPGHAGVLTEADGRVTVVGEGAIELPPDAVIDDFDLRQQTRTGNVTAITGDGVPVMVWDPTFGYHVVADELAGADAAIGPDGARALIAAIAESAVGSVIAGYRFDDLDSAHLRQAESRIAAIAAARLRPYHVALDSVELNGVRARLAGYAGSVTATSVWEQRAVEERTNIDVARRAADNLRAKAAGIAAANRSLAPTLTAGVLEDAAIVAWRRLITARETSVRVANDSSTMLEVSP